MATKQQIGAGIARLTATGAATGVVVRILRLTPAVRAAVIAIVIGTAVARSAFSSAECDKAKSKLGIECY